MRKGKGPKFSEQLINDRITALLKLAGGKPEAEVRRYFEAARLLSGYRNAPSQLDKHKAAQARRIATLKHDAGADPVAVESATFALAELTGMVNAVQAAVGRSAHRPAETTTYRPQPLQRRSIHPG